MHCRYVDVFVKCSADDPDSLFSLDLAMMVSARQRGRHVCMHIYHLPTRRCVAPPKNGCTPRWASITTYSKILDIERLDYYIKAKRAIYGRNQNFLHSIGGIQVRHKSVIGENIIHSDSRFLQTKIQLLRSAGEPPIFACKACSYIGWQMAPYRCA